MEIRKIVAIIIFAMALIYIYGLSLMSFLVGFEGTPITGFAIIVSLILNVIVMCGSAILCTMLFYRIGIKGTLKKLQIRFKNVPFNIFLGMAFAIIFLISMTVIFAFFIIMGYDIPENPLGEEIIKSMTLPLLVFVPLLSSISEELFFRGFMQSKIGLVPTSILFGLAHISYQNLLQIIIPIVLGFFLGILLIKTKNLLAPISAHFTFNFIQLSMGYLFQLSF